MSIDPLESTLHASGNSNKVLLQEQLEQLLSFKGERREFLALLLQTKSALTGAAAGILLHLKDEGYAIEAAAPAVENTAPPQWLREAIQHLQPLAEKADNARSFRLGEVSDGRGAKLQRYAIAMPLLPGTAEQGWQIYLYHIQSISGLSHPLQLLQAMSPVFAVYHLNCRYEQQVMKTGGIHRVSELLQELSGQKNYRASILTLVNKLCTAYGCTRVSFGRNRGKYARCFAVSNVEKFKSKSSRIRAAEGVMEECLDQDIEVLWPAPEEQIAVSRFSSDYSRENKVSTLSLPLRHQGKLRGALLLEREEEKPFDLQEMRELRLLLDLFTAEKYLLHRDGRWFFQRWWEDTRRALGWIFGVKNTGFKLIALALIAVGAWLYQAKGTWHLEATFSIEAASRRTITSPFNGQIVKILIKNGQRIEEGELLFVLDTSEDELQLIELREKLKKNKLQQKRALQENEHAERLSLAAEADGLQAELQRIEQHIRRAQIRATSSGIAIAVDIDRRLFASVSQGETILEILAPESLYAMLHVPEDQIDDVADDAVGEFAVAGYPERKIPFSVTDKEFMARPLQDGNVFRVRADYKATEQAAFLRPGMEGAARIDAGERHLAWIWTRSAINWLRMKLWL